MVITVVVASSTYFSWLFSKEFRARSVILESDYFLFTVTEAICLTARPVVMPYDSCPLCSAYMHVNSAIKFNIIAWQRLPSCASRLFHPDVLVI
jgi:hypothetical protein